MPNRRAVYLKCEAWRWAMPGVGLESATRTPRANGERTERAGKRIPFAFCRNSFIQRLSDSRKEI